MSDNSRIYWKWDGKSRRTERRHRLKEIQEALGYIQEPTLHNQSDTLENKNYNVKPVHLVPLSLSTSRKDPNNSLSSVINVHNSFDDTVISAEKNESGMSHLQTFQVENRSLNIGSRKFLQSWALKHNITHVAIKDLLFYFNEVMPQQNLPKDPRTLLGTPAGVVKQFVSGGSCIYFNLESLITQRVKIGLKTFHDPIFLSSENSVANTDKLLTLSLGIDGIPITKSTNKQFWPVLGKLDQSRCREPFVICLFYSDKKPENLDFINPLIESFELLESKGILVDNVTYDFRISKILADAPARSLIKKVKNHNGYSSCERCQQEGNWVGKIVFPYEVCAPRTNESFRLRKDSAHHVGISPFTSLKIDLVKQVPLDYLHLILLGVVRRLFRMWVKGKLPYRIRSCETVQISKRLVSYRKYFPSCIQRKPRSITEIDHFKGTEFRSLLLYSGFPAIVGLIDRKRVKHFLLLHCAMFILLSKWASEQSWNKLANNYLHKFVTNGSDLYGVDFLVYNVHGLMHLAEDSKSFGSLDNCSTFQFENYMQKIKLIMRANNNFLEQAYKRIGELQNVPIEKSKDINTRAISSKIGNNCFLLNCGKIVIINQCLDDCTYLVQDYLTKEQVKEYPLDSRLLHIYYVKQLSLSYYLKLVIDDILVQFVRLPFKQSYICIPLLHTI